MKIDKLTLIGLGTLSSDADIIFPVNPDDIIRDDSFEIPACTLSAPKSFECELEATLEDINISLLKELSTTKPEPFYMTHDGVRYEQIRKHKKKRINKKWAKRYGYRDIPVRYYYENCYISPKPFNDFAVTCDRVRMEDI